MPLIANEQVRGYFPGWYDIFRSTRYAAKNAARAAAIVRAQHLVAGTFRGIVPMRDNRVSRRLVNLEATILVSMALSQDDVADWRRRYSSK
jgi:hypothetical protein